MISKVDHPTCKIFHSQPGRATRVSLLFGPRTPNCIVVAKSLLMLLACDEHCIPISLNLGSWGKVPNPFPILLMKVIGCSSKLECNLFDSLSVLIVPYRIWEYFTQVATCFLIVHGDMKLMVYPPCTFCCSAFPHLGYHSHRLTEVRRVFFLLLPGFRLVFPVQSYGDGKLMVWWWFGVDSNILYSWIIS